VPFRATQEVLELQVGVRGAGNHQPGDGGFVHGHRTYGTGVRWARENRGVPPRPGDPCPGFMAEPGRCWRLVYSKQTWDPPITYDGAHDGGM
jgi:hypothetical protein